MKKLLLPALVIFCISTTQAQDMQGYRNPAADERIPLEENLRQTSAEALQATLYELISQRHAVQQAHWNVQGPRFYALHDLLGHFYEDLGPKIDMIAERKLALGVSADGRPTAVAEAADLEPVPEGYMDDQRLLDLLTARYKTISDRLYERIEATGDDLVTQDMLINVTGMIDDQLWKLRAFQ
ncbi:MAG: Dps family protein, partial [Cyclobacteriaceae bacterium]